jgi:hypothetical protein
MAMKQTIEPVLQAAAQIAPAVSAPSPVTLLGAAPAAFALLKRYVPQAIAVARRYPVHTAAVAAGLLLLAALSNGSRERR